MSQLQQCGTQGGTTDYPTPVVTGPMYPLPNNEDFNKPCTDLSYDDSHCAGLNQCCVGVHDFGAHKRCTSAVRKCRKLGNQWDAARRLTPLAGEYLYTDAPGYTTTGHLKEGFIGDLLNLQCMTNNAVFALLMIVFLFMYKGHTLDMQEILVLTAVTTFIKCALL